MQERTVLLSSSVGQRTYTNMLILGNPKAVLKAGYFSPEMNAVGYKFNRTIFLSVDNPTEKLTV